MIDSSAFSLVDNIDRQKHDWHNRAFVFFFGYFSQLQGGGSGGPAAAILNLKIEFQITNSPNKKYMILHTGCYRKAFGLKGYGFGQGGPALISGDIGERYDLMLLTL